MPMNTIRKMSKSILLIAAAFVSIPAFAEGVYIESLIFNGSGCKLAETSGQLVDVDKDSFPYQKVNLTRLMAKTT
jgi:hypothetical protein